MSKATVLGALVLAGTLASPAMADDFSGFRLGLNLSQDMWESDYYEGPVADGTPVDPTNSNRFGYGLFGGWAPNKWVAIEAGLVGGSKFSTDIFPDDNGDDFYDVSRLNLKGVEASVVGTLWIGEKFALFGRAGMFGWKAEVSESYGFVDDPDSQVKLEVDDNGFEPMFGIGMQTVLDRALVRLEYKMTEIGDFRYFDNGGTTSTADDIEYNWISNEISSVSFSVVWSF